MSSFEIGDLVVAANEGGLTFSRSGEPGVELLMKPRPSCHGSWS